MARRKIQKTKWEELYDEYRSIYPRLKKDAVGFTPADEVSIIVHLTGGKRMFYDGVQHRAKIMAG